MATPHKIEQVEDLTTLLRGAEIAISTTYQGLPVSELTAMRRTFRTAGAQMRVVKNTLLRRAAAAVGREVYGSLVDGPTAIIVGTDPIATARVVMQYRREHMTSPFQVLRAVYGAELVDAAYVDSLSTVPPREVLLARIAGNLTSKVAELAGLLQATTRDFAGLVEARAKQLETA